MGFHDISDGYYDDEKKDEDGDKAVADDEGDEFGDDEAGDKADAIADKLDDLDGALDKLPGYQEAEEEDEDEFLTHLKSMSREDHDGPDFFHPDAV